MSKQNGTRSFLIVLQENQREMSHALLVEKLKRYLNTMGWQHFEAVATSRVGVFETFKTISNLVISKL